MTELDELLRWLKFHTKVAYCIDDGVLRFKMFDQYWEVWQDSSYLAFGQKGIYLMHGDWRDIAKYLIEYSMSKEYQLNRIANALEELNERGMVTFDGGDIDA